MSFLLFVVIRLDLLLANHTMTAVNEVEVEVE